MTVVRCRPGAVAGQFVHRLIKQELMRKLPHHTSAFKVGRIRRSGTGCQP